MKKEFIGILSVIAVLLSLGICIADDVKKAETITPESRKEQRLKLERLRREILHMYSKSEMDERDTSLALNYVINIDLTIIQSIAEEHGKHVNFNSGSGDKKTKDKKENK